MLNRVIHRNTESISLFNPSIRDFVISRYSRDHVVMRAVFDALRTDDSVFAIKALMSGGFVEAGFVRNLLQYIVREADVSGYVEYSPAYIARVYLALSEMLPPQELERLPIAGAAEFVEREDLPRAFEEVLDFLWLAHERGLDVPRSARRLILQGCEREPSTNELECMARLIDAGDCDLEVRDTFRRTVVEVLANQAHEEFPASDLFDGLYYDEDHWEAKSKLREMIGERLDDFGFGGDEDLIGEIADGYDLDDQARDYYMGHGRSDGEIKHATVITSVDDIDDLFDRS